MARIRSVSPDICTDQGLVGLSANAERLWVRLWTHLDDEGRCEDDLLLLKAALFPRHRHIGEDEIEEWIGELVRNGQVIRYEVDGLRCLSAKPDAWAKYQKPRRRVASKLPAPPEPDLDARCADNDRTRTDMRGKAPTGGGGVVGEGDVEEKEGESEGEPEQPAIDPSPVDISPLAARALTVTQRIKPGHARLSLVTESNPAAERGPGVVAAGVAGTNRGGNQ